MKRFSAIAAALLLAAVPLGATSLDGQKTYDLLFKNGTLDQIGSDTSLVYRRDVTNALMPEAAERSTGDVALSFQNGEARMAQLELRQGEKRRALGRFPASVGNPMIMYFYETVVRDMAESAGGSPYYLRNRVKDALVQPSDMVEGETEFGGRTVPTVTIVMSPFADDPNRAKMQGFGDLELRVTMSEAVPGWYLSLVAEAAGETTVYRSALEFDRLEEGQ